MRRVIGMDLHRTFAEVVVWENGRLRHAGRVDMTRSGLEGFARSLQKTDEVVIEATGNPMVVSHLLTPHVARVVIANPIQVKAIAHAHVKTDKIDAGVLANLHAAGYLPEVWTPDEGTERLPRMVSRRNQVVRHGTRLKNETHSILHAHLVPRCPHADLFSRVGRAWLERQVLPDDERLALARHRREFDHFGEALAVLDEAIGKATVDDPAVRRLLTVTGINVTVAAGLAAAIGDIRRFSTPQKLVSYFGLSSHMRQSGFGLAQHGRISKAGRSHARAMLVEATWAAAKAPGPLHASLMRVRARRGHQIAAMAPRCPGQRLVHQAEVRGVAGFLSSRRRAAGGLACPSGAGGASRGALGAHSRALWHLRSHARRRWLEGSTDPCLDLARPAYRERRRGPARPYHPDRENVRSTPLLDRSLVFPGAGDVDYHPVNAKLYSVVLEPAA